MIKDKKITLVCVILTVLLFGVLFAAVDHDPWDGTVWDVTAPDIDQPAGDHYKEMQDLRKGVALRMNKEHETLATSSAGGVHKQGSARAFFQDAAPTTQVNGDAFDSGDLGSLWFDSNADPDNQFNVLTATTPTWTPISTEIIAVLLASNRQFAGTLTVDGATTLTGAVGAAASITLGAGADLIGSATSDITFNTDKFTVAGATGNTVIAGTCAVTGTLGVTGVATVAKGSLLASSDAPTTDAMIANKKYVDDHGIIQVVNVTESTGTESTTILPVDDTLPAVAEGVEIFTLAITPTSATNKLLIQVVLQYRVNTAGVSTGAALFDNSNTCIAAAIGGQSNYQSYGAMVINHWMTSGVATELTFKVRFGPASTGSANVNGYTFGGVSSSSMTITEIKG